MLVAAGLLPGHPPKVKHPADSLALNDKKSHSGDDAVLGSLRMHLR